MPGISFQKKMDAMVGITTDRLTAVHELDIFPYFRDRRRASLEMNIVIPPAKPRIVIAFDSLNVSKKNIKSAIKNTAEILSAAINDILSQPD